LRDRSADMPSTPVRMLADGFDDVSEPRLQQQLLVDLAVPQTEEQDARCNANWFIGVPYWQSLIPKGPETRDLST